MTKKILILLLTLTIAGALAYTQDRGKGFKGRGGGSCIFVDENGDGINDNFKDHDGDGIPNYEDPDWTRPQDGSGFKNGNRIKGRKGRQSNKGNCSSFNQRSRLNRQDSSRCEFGRASGFSGRTGGRRGSSRGGGSGRNGF